MNPSTYDMLNACMTSDVLPPIRKVNNAATSSNSASQRQLQEFNHRNNHVNHVLARSTSTSTTTTTTTTTHELTNTPTRV